MLKVPEICTRIKHRTLDQEAQAEDNAVGTLGFVNGPHRQAAARMAGSPQTTSQTTRHGRLGSRGLVFRASRVGFPRSPWAPLWESPSGVTFFARFYGKMGLLPFNP